MAAGGLMEKSAVGRREDLADLIAIVDTRGCPFSSMVSKSGEPTATFFEWQLDKYATPKDPTTSTVDGTDVADFENASADQARIGNYIHYFRRSGKVSTLAQQVATIAGDANPIGRSRAKKLVEIKRDQEVAFLSSGEMNPDDGSTGYRTRGLGKWIQATAQSVNAVPASYRPASAQIITTACASLTEDTDVQGILTAIFDACGMNGDYKLFAGSVLRRRFTDMTRTVANTNSTATKVRTFQNSGSAKAIECSTTSYEGDFGTITVVPSSWINATVSGSTITVDTDCGYLVDMDKVHLRLHANSVKPLQDEGGGPRFLIESWAGLQVDSPLGMGKFLP